MFRSVEIFEKFSKTFETPQRSVKMKMLVKFSFNTIFYVRGEKGQIHLYKKERQASNWRNPYVILVTGKAEINKAVIVTPASLVKVSLVEILKLERDILLEFKIRYILLLYIFFILQNWRGLKQSSGVQLKTSRLICCTNQTTGFCLKLSNWLKCVRSTSGNKKKKRINFIISSYYINWSFKRKLLS